ncbi:APC family permease [Pullulanibacillus sp. KACC 23026]|uniref:APC family permease n=1 Tax=Pullulanibacillus sp. KACC 23026 TaxID=3028315 RepID=UPI0023AFD241|nr:APC family permease [Pullulanibacillus sp. KACC 23026]WEG12014.1 APC family permease [Pullulanibacillus sp. KACC 23026]
MASGKLKRQLSFLDLTFIGLGSIVGSGWLFASQKGAITAGPAAWLSWVIGAVAVLLLGFVYAELGGAIPRAGGSVRYGEFSHGPLLGYLSGFASIIAFSSVAGIEVEAVRQYAETWFPQLGSSSPTVLGWFVQFILLLIFFFLNMKSVSLFGKTNTIITAIKFIVPVLTIIVLLTQLKVSNFTSHGFAPMGFSGIEQAVSTSGIIFAFLGFQQAVSFASEAKNPQKSLPLSLLTAVFLSAALYILLQLTFIGATPTSALSGGWAGLHYTSPFANVAAALGLGWLSNVILADAVVSPSGTANIYLSATSRVIFAWAKGGTFFKKFGEIDDKTGVPRPALILAFILSVFFTLPFPSWDQLVGVVSSATVLTYIMGPVSMHAFRKTAPDLYRPYKLKGYQVISPLAFVIASLIVYWTGWHTDSWLLGMSIVMYAIFFFIKNSHSKVTMRQQIKSSAWLMAYYIAMFILSYLGTFDGGQNIIQGPYDQIIVAVVSLIIYYWGVNTGLPQANFETEEEAA